MIITDKYVFFFGGVCSQWVPSKFTIDGIEYNCAEQYMMAKKAELFKDAKNYEKIMNADHPRDQKRYGRQVKNFDYKKWSEVSRDIVFDGNMAKFTQNPRMMNKLLSYENRKIVEASSTDTIWGIGLGLNDPRIFDEREWRGTNWLGEVIMEVRHTLIAKFQSKERPEDCEPDYEWLSDIARGR